MTDRPAHERLKEMARSIRADWDKDIRADTLDAIADEVEHDKGVSDSIIKDTRDQLDDAQISIHRLTEERDDAIMSRETYARRRKVALDDIDRLQARVVRLSEMNEKLCQHIIAGNETVWHGSIDEQIVNEARAALEEE